MTVMTTLALAGAMLLLAVTPGPGVFATIARALVSGFSHAAVVVGGIVLGDILFLLLAIYGLAVVAEWLGGLFTIVKYIGGLYLIWLGWQVWRNADKPLPIQGVNETSWHVNFFSGLAITLGNPKVILFYLGFLPTFMDITALTLSDVVIAASVVSAVLAAVLLSYAYLAARASRALTEGHAAKRLHAMAGGVMMGTGAVLITRS
ncbi:MAG: LysE family translocator [Chromatiales bacterium]|nr:LysE family translocator [Chromatiales bacterium]